MPSLSVPIEAATMPLLYLWWSWSSRKRFQAESGKLQRDTCTGHQAFQLLGQVDVITVVTVRQTNSTIFCYYGYWQFSVYTADLDIQKNTFCPGPGMGLYHFEWMAFRPTGASGSFQCLISNVPTVVSIIHHSDKITTTMNSLTGTKISVWMKMFSLARCFI